MIGYETASKIVFVCSDMWKPYLKVIREKCAEALPTSIASTEKSRGLLLKRGDNLKPTIASGCATCSATT